MNAGGSSRCLARVNLSQRRVAIEEVSDELVKGFLGGRGYGARFLYDLVPPESKPESAQNVIIISTGLFSPPWPAACRYHVTFRSPLTGIYGYANAGGRFGPYLAACGFSALVIKGRADSPVYLLVGEGRVEIEPAKEIWGRTTGKTEAYLHNRYPNASVASIGPAGEHGVLFSSLINDGGRAAARCGGGAVFGSKNLKAIAVLPTRRATPQKKFLAEARRATKKVLSSPNVSSFRKWGTPLLVAIKNEIGDLPAKNHQSAQVSFVEQVDAHAFDHYRIKSKSCLGCPIGCGRISVVDTGVYRCRTGGPEYETIDAFGPMCDCANPKVIIHANMLCNELGLDTISTGVTIAFAMECYEKGLLKDTELDLSWGDGETIVKLIKLIAKREGLGALLAEGVKKAAESLGGEAKRYAMEVKGMEIPRQEPRVAKAFGLGHATSNRGADHLYALPTIDLAGLEEVGTALLPHAMPALMDLADEEFKPDLVKLSEEYCAISDSVGICKFTTVENYALLPVDVAAGVSALGHQIDADELLRIGERIINLERMYNVRLGLSSVDDRLPARFTEEPLSVKHGTNVTYHKIEDLKKMLAKYYELRGWDENGIPTAEKLRELGLH